MRQELGGVELLDGQAMGCRQTTESPWGFFFRCAPAPVAFDSQCWSKSTWKTGDFSRLIVGQKPQTRKGRHGKRYA